MLRRVYQGGAGTIIKDKKNGSSTIRTAKKDDLGARRHGECSEMKKQILSIRGSDSALARAIIMEIAEKV